MESSCSRESLRLQIIFLTQDKATSACVKRTRSDFYDRFKETLLQPGRLSNPFEAQLDRDAALSILRDAVAGAMTGKRFFRAPPAPIGLVLTTGRT